MSAAACTPDAINIRAAAAALGGDVVGRDAVLCPGPNHSAADRSLSVRFYGDNFVVHSHAGDTWQECRDHVRKLLNLPPPAEPKRSAPSPAVRDNDTGQRALEIWRETVPLPGTPGEVYLASRGVRYDGDRALRWHPNCPFSPGVRVGCMVGLVRNIGTNEPQAVHRTAISPTGQKLSGMGNNGRLTLGPTRGGAVKLTDDADVERVIAIGEGIETTLSIRHLPDLEQMPLWCVLNAGGIQISPCCAASRRSGSPSTTTGTAPARRQPCRARSGSRHPASRRGP